MERFIRKLFGLTFSALLAVVLLVGCISNNLGDEKSMNIKIDGIEQITVSTQTTGQKQDVIIEKEKFEDLISKLNSYSLKEITDEYLTIQEDENEIKIDRKNISQVKWGKM